MRGRDVPPCFLCEDVIHELEPILPIAFFTGRSDDDGAQLGSAPVHLACAAELVRKGLPGKEDPRDLLADQLLEVMEGEREERRQERKEPRKRSSSR